MAANSMPVVPQSDSMASSSRTSSMIRSQHEQVSMNPSAGQGSEASGHAVVVNLKSTNMMTCVSSHEPVTPRNNNNGTSSMLMLTVNCPRNFEADHLNASSCQIVPTVGMCFQSQEEAYKFYNSYARTKGFSIRWTHKRLRADGSLCSKYLVCSKDGVKAIHPTHETRKEQASTRTCCKARVQFSITREGLWNIQKVVLDHNHHLVTPDKSHMLRSQRQLLDADRYIINHMRTAGIRPSEIYNFYEEWVSGADNMPFLEMDCNNYIRTERRKYLESKDAQTVLDYLKNKQADDPSFFYAVQINEEDGRIANFFWADGQSIMDYACFGDVVSFDTTFSTNKFKMPFALLLGVNHHKQTIVFGAALLFDETTESFVWLFESFLKAMSGKQPQTIFTDQCAAIIKAIGKVFLDTIHCLCVWHLYQNAAKHLSHVIGDNPEFLKELKKCVYEDRSVAHFEMKWHDLLVQYKLQENSWINNMYKFREKWATVYRRDSFSGDMTSTQRSEGMNNVFKKTFRGKLSLSELLEKCDKCNARLRWKEKYEDFKSRHSEPVRCISYLPILKTAAESYTRTLYSEFEEEIKRQFDFSCVQLSSEGTNNTYKVTSFKYKDDEAIVVFNPTVLDISCSCKLYGCIGILCKHAHKVLTHCNVVTLPSQYIMNRWTKYAKRDIFSKPTDTDNPELLFAHISRKMISLVLKCKPSKEVLAHVNNGIDKLALEAADLLSKVILDEEEDSDSYLELNEDVAKTRVSFKAPIRVKGPMNKRTKGALEGTTKGKKNATSEKGEIASDSTMAGEIASDSTMAGEIASDSTMAGPMELSVHPAEPLEFSGTLHSHAITDNISPFSSGAMSFADYPAMFPPALPGEFTSLLLQAHENATVSTSARRLDFQ